MSGIRIELEYSDGNFGAGMARAGSTLQQFEAQSGRTVVGVRRISEASQGLLGTMRDLTAVFGLAGAAIHNIHSVTTGVVGSIIKVNAEFEKMTVLLKGMSQASDPLKDAQQQVQYLRDFAQKVPFSITAITDSFTKMKATGIDPMAGSLQSLADGIAAMGGTDEHLKRATLAMTQMSGKGVIQMEELRQQLGEAMPRAVELMARSMGVSMSQLIKDIATGTMQAKPALEAFQRELDRTYGGAAAEQMKTFNGQLTVLTSNLQNMALKVGEAGFFDAIKSQMSDLNGFLSGDKSKSMAGGIGEALATAVTYLRSGLDFVIRWKDEIGAAAKWMLIAFSANVAMSGIRSITAGLENMRLGVSSVRTQWELVNRAIETNIASSQTRMAANTAAMMAPSIAQNAAANRLMEPGIVATATPGATAVALNGVKNAGIGVASAFVVAKGAISVAGTALMAFAPWIPLIAGGVVLLVEAFGLFQNKARDAWQELEKVGATSQKQIDLSREYINQEQAKIDKLDRLIETEKKYEEIRKSGSRSFTSRSVAAGITSDDGAKALDMRTKQDAVNSARRIKLADEEVLFQDRVAAKEADKAMELISLKMSGEKAVFDKAGIEAQKAHEKARALLASENRDVSLLDVSYGVETQKRNVAYHNQKIKFLEMERDLAISHLDDTDEASQQKNAKLVQRLGEDLSREKERRDSAQNQVMGSTLLPKTLNGEELFKKGVSFLEKLKADAVGAKASIQGLDGEVATLAEMLKGMKFGDAMIPRVQELIDKILLAKQETIDLNKIVAGGQKMEAESLSILNNERDKLLDLQMKAAGKDGASAIEKFEFKKANGGFDGYGTAQTVAQQKLIDLRKSMTQFGETSAGVGKILTTELFGSPLMTAANGFLSMIEKIGGVINGLRNGGSLASIFGGVNGSMTTGMTGDDMQKYRDAIAMIESRGKPNNGYSAIGPTTNKGDNAYGRYQIMGANIPSWTRDSLGASMSTQDFLNNPEAQDKVFNHMFGKLMQKHGSAEDAASAWLTGQPRSAGNTAEDANGTNSSKYVAQFQKNLQELGMTLGAVRPVSGAPIAGSPEANTNSNIDLAKEIEKKQKELAPGVAIAAMMDKVKLEISEALEQAGSATDDNKGKNVAAVKKMIRRGDFNNGQAETDVEQEKYKELIALYEKLDQAEEKASNRKKARAAGDAAAKNMDGLLGSKKNEVADALREYNDPNTADTTKAYAALRKAIEANIEAIKELHGAESQQYADAKKNGADILNMELQKTSLAASAKMKTDTKANLRSMMPEREQARAAFEEMKTLRYNEIMASNDAVDIRQKKLADFYAWVKSEESKLGASGPLGQLGKDWSDLSKNMEQSMATAFSGVADGLAGMLTGQKVNFQQILQSFAKDMMKNVIQSAMAPLMKSMSGMFSGGGGGFGKSGAGAGGAAAKGGGAAKSVGVAHTGGIVGSPGLSMRSVDLGMFVGAPKFHTGGVIGSDEVPIIAKKGEGVFTQQQMKAMGGGGAGRVVQLQNNVTVNANGGTKEQNDDLSQKISKQVEIQARSMVVDEMRRQMRPGNIMNR